MQALRWPSAAIDTGFSLTELVVSSALLLLIVLAAIAVANPVIKAAHSQPEAIDLQQRARMATSSLFRDLYAAGAGPELGATYGSLGQYFAAILPRRIGAETAEPPTTARTDVISIIWAPITRVQTTLVAPFATSPMVVRDEPGCPVLQPACGARTGMGLLLFDRSGAFDLLTADTVSGSGVVVRPRGPPPFHPYGDDARVVEVEARTYYVDTAARQLRQYDTDQTDVPVADNVVGMSIEYFGTAAPPVTPKPPLGQATCLYDAAGQRLSGMTQLVAGDDGLAPLPVESLGDGPWCGSGVLAYDADLLRVRRVRVTLRLQVSPPAIRGTVPDAVLSFEVSPRNLERVE